MCAICAQNPGRRQKTLLPTKALREKWRVLCAYCPNGTPDASRETPLAGKPCPASGIPGFQGSIQPGSIRHRRMLPEKVLLFQYDYIMTPVSGATIITSSQGSTQKPSERARPGRQKTSSQHSMNSVRKNSGERSTPITPGVGPFR